MPINGAHLTNTPQFIGMLYNADPVRTTFLSIIGGAGGGRAKFTSNPEFATSVTYNIGNGSQPAISEEAALTVRIRAAVVKTQAKNVTQIFQDFVQITRRREAAFGRLTGVHTAGTSPEDSDELGFQLNAAIAKNARDINYTFINGTYSEEGLTDGSKADKTRGILSAITTNVVDASSGALSKTMLDQLFLKLFNLGTGTIDGVTLLVTAANKQKITAIYKADNTIAVPRDRFVAGINVTSIVTDFGTCQIAIDNDMPNDTILAFNLNDETGRQIISPVHGQVPAREGETKTDGYMLIQKLPIAGGSQYEIYHETGLDHGPEMYHGKIINLT